MLGSMTSTNFNKGPNLNATSNLDALTETNLQPNGATDYATLAGPTVKAANTRQSLPFLKYIADRHLTDESNIDHVLIHLLIRHTLEFNRVRTFFTDAEVHDQAADERAQALGELRVRRGLGGHRDTHRSAGVG